MEQKFCIKCGKPNPEYEPRFVTVGVISSSSTSYSGRKQVTTTTTSERITGVDRCCVCEDCIRKKRISSAIGAALGGLLGGTFVTFIMAIFFMGKSFNDHAMGAFLVSLLVGVAVCVGVFIHQMKEDMPFLAAALLKKARNDKAVALENKRYIPVDASIYHGKNSTQPDLEVFKNKTALKTNIGPLIFMQYVASGMGDQLVDQMLLQQQNPAAQPNPER